MTQFVLNTQRLTLRQFTPDDAAVVLELLNEPSFKKFVGDKGVRTLDDARSYLEKGPLESYVSNGYGVYLTLDTLAELPVGMCGLFKRDNLELPDLGFAFFAHSCGKGYALESARAVIDYARETLDLPMVCAVANPDNVRSTSLPEKLGFLYKHPYRMPNEDIDLNYYELYLQE
jgi:ribosomal-protein-alanine N-acetyltransferase